MAFFVFIPIVLGLLLAIGLLVHAAIRGNGKAAALAGAVFLASFLFVGFCFFAVRSTQHARVEQARAETLHETVFQRHQAMMAEAVARQEEAMERIRHASDRIVPVPNLVPATSPFIPIEAPRPPREVDGAESLTTTEVASIIPSSPLPEWVSTGARDEGDRRYVVVMGQQFADREIARRDALENATDLVRRHFESSHPLRDSWTADFPGGAWSLSREVVQNAAVRQNYTESIRRTAGENDFTVYRTYMLVELSPAVLSSIEPVWRTQVATGRSFTVGAIFALIAAAAGVFAGYFRLADRMQGRYRWTLRLGALVLLTLVGATVIAGTAVAAKSSRPSTSPAAGTIVHESPNTEIPSDVFEQPVVDLPQALSDAQSQCETSADRRNRERFREVAERIVQAINAGDYEGVRQDFNEIMLDKFPVETCRTFFGETISDKYGKINELEPRLSSEAISAWLVRCERGTLVFTLVLDEHGQVAGMLFRPRSGGMPFLSQDMSPDPSEVQGYIYRW